jgi:hypothetical protein
MSLKSLLAKLSKDKAAKSPEKTDAQPIEDPGEKGRQKLISACGIPEAATLSIIKASVGPAYDPLAEIIFGYGERANSKLDTTMGTDLAGSVRFMRGQYCIFMEDITAVPESLNSALAASRYLNELVTFYGQSMKLAEKEGIDPQFKPTASALAKAFYEIALLYFVFQNGANGSHYPETYGDFSSQRLGIAVAKDQPPDQQQEATGAESKPSNP